MFGLGIIPRVCLATVAAGLFGVPALPVFVIGTLIVCAVSYRITGRLAMLRLAVGTLLVSVTPFLLTELFPSGETGAGFLLGAWPAWIMCSLAMLSAGLAVVLGPSAEAPAEPYVGSANG